MTAVTAKPLRALHTAVNHRGSLRTMFKLILLTGLLALLAASGATTLAFISIKPGVVEQRIVTTYLQKLNGNLALP